MMTSQIKKSSRKNNISDEDECNTYNKEEKKTLNKNIVLAITRNNESDSDSDDEIIDSDSTESESNKASFLFSDSEDDEDLNEDFSKRKEFITFPISGKLPTISGWQKLKKSVKNDGNYGIQTGERSGISVVDIDTHDEGQKYWDILLDSKLINLNNPIHVLTGSGGSHYYYKYDKDLKNTSKMLTVEENGNIKKVGVDVRTRGGFVVGAGSMHPVSKTKYKILSNPNRIPKMDKILKALLMGKMRLKIDGKSATIIENKQSTTLRTPTTNANVALREPKLLKRVLDGLKDDRCDDSDTWRNVLMAIGSIGKTDEMIDIADEWSQKSLDYESRDDVKRHVMSSEGKITDKSLWYFLRDDNPTLFKVLLAEAKSTKIKDLLRREESDSEDEDEIEEKPKENKHNTVAFDRHDEYCWLDFDEQHREVLYESEEEMLLKVIPDLNRVFARIEMKQGFIVKKDDCKENLISVYDRKRGCTDIAFRYAITKTIKKTTKQGEQATTHTEIKSIDFAKFIKKYAKLLNRYATIKCDPMNKNPKVFNLWRGMKAELVDEVNMDLVQPMLDFYKEVWCAENPDLLMPYLLSWFHCTFFELDRICRAFIVLISPEQGAGKTTGMDHINEFIVGEDSSLIVSGLAPLTASHNKSIQGVRFLGVNEMASTREEFKSNFETLKSLVTDPVCYINPKGVDQYSIRNLACGMMTTQHKDSMIVEKGDRRYCCMRMSPHRVGDVKYFNELRKKCFNQEAGNHFYTYIHNLKKEDLVPVDRPPVTKVKKEMIQISLPSCLKYLLYLQEEKKEKALLKEENKYDMSDSEEEDSNLVQASQFYENYKEWCVKNGERAVSNTKFGIKISDSISKIRNWKGRFYDTDTIKI